MRVFGCDLGCGYAYGQWEIIGRIAAQRGEYERALPNLSQALQAYEELGDRGGSAEALDRAAHTGMIAEIRKRIGEDFGERWDADRTLSFAEIRTIVGEIASAPSGAGNATPPAPRKPDARSLIKELRITEREIEVLALVAAGKTDKDIAEELFISVRTVQSHVANLLTKLDVNVRSAAVARAIRSGIIL